MKKLGKSTKKGFTLVELIVVLVILAVLAAMLVPALVGYIDRAKAEKEYQTAATVYGAAQAVITEKYAKNEFTDAEKSAKKIVTGAELKSMGGTGKDAVIILAGVDSKAVTGYEFSFTDNIISGGNVTISGYKYTLTITNGVPSWSAEKAGTTTQQPAQGGQGN